MIEAESLQWRHNAHDGDSTHQPHDCLLIRLFRRKSKKTSNLRVIGLCAGNSPVTGEFPAQRASNAENVWLCYLEITFSINRCCDADEGWGQLRIWDTCYRGILWGGVLVWFQVRRAMSWRLFSCEIRSFNLFTISRRWDLWLYGLNYVTKIWISHILL